MNNVVSIVKPANDTRPVIQLGPELDQNVDDAIGAIGLHPETYQRNHRLVHVLRSPEGPYTESPLIRTMPTATIREALTRVAVWHKFDKRLNDYKPTHPSDPVVHAVRDRGDYPSVRYLRGVIEAPAVRPDGSIIQTSGYDRPTGWLYEPNASFAAVPERPTMDDAKRALAEVLEVVADFPFATGAHRSGFLALLLTLFARPAIDGPVPGFGISAPTRGTGKTKIAEIAAVLKTGRDPFKHSFPENNAEMRKVITTALADGDVITIFDNLDGPAHGAALDAALTTVSWGDRELAKNSSLNLINSTVFVFTGNNLEYGGDTSRRVLPIVLESPLENPENRGGFKHHPLLTWVKAERTRLVVAVLTMVRAWFVAGCPCTDKVKPWGSYEAWTRVVPSIIVWLGETDPTTTRAQMDCQDGEKSALQILIDCWSQLDPQGRGLQCGHVLRLLWPDHKPVYDDQGNAKVRPDAASYFEPMREAILSLTKSEKAPSSQKLGSALRSRTRRVCGGKCFDSVPGLNNTTVWKVISVAPQQGT